MKIIHASNKIDQIGYQTENDRTQVLFDLSDIIQDFPGGMPTLVIRRPGEENATPVFSISMDGTNLVWTVGAYEIEHKGTLKAQIIYTVSETIVKTKIYCFNVNESLLNIDPEPPEWQDWVSELLSAASGVYDDVQQAKQAAVTATEKAAIAVQNADIAHAEAELALRRANDADQSATIASQKAEEIVQSAQTASEKALEARVSASNAAISAQNAAQKAGDVEAGVLAAEGHAKGTQNGTPVESGSPYYQNNAKYFSDQAMDAVGQYNDMTAEATTLPVGATPTAEIDHSGDHPNLILGIPAGPGSGTTDYESLENKPRIQGVELNGNKTAHQLGMALIEDLPTKVSELYNDRGYISGYVETDPTVPNWAKENHKPTYTAQEVGAATEEIVSVSSQQPTDEGNKLWIKDQPGSVVAVPTYEEHQVLQSKVDHVIAVQDEQPDTNYTKVWIEETPPPSVQVPTYGEFMALFNSFGSLGLSVYDGEICMYCEEVGT